MSYLDLYPESRANLMERAAVPAEALEPSPFAGSISALPRGAALALGDSATLAGDAFTPWLQRAVRPLDAVFGTDLEGFAESERMKNREFIRDMTPDPTTTGAVANVLTGVVRTAAPVAGGFVVGGPAGAAVTSGVLTGYAAAVDAEEHGASPDTAALVGFSQGLPLAAGVVLPLSIASRGLVNVAWGAGTSVSLGVVSRGTAGAVLENAGHAEMAAQYQTLDKVGLATDVILGAMLGGLGTPRQRAGMKPSDADVALAGNAAHHLELDTAPGIPANPESRSAHVAAVQEAISALSEGRTVAVDVAAADYVPSPHAAQARSAITEAVGDHARALGVDEAVRNLGRLEAEAAARGIALEDDGIAVPAGRALDPMPEAPNLTPAARAVEKRIREKILGDVDAAIAEYGRLKDSQGGKVLNTDVARELSPDYRGDRSALSAAVHEPSSWLVKEIYRRKLAEEPGPGEQPVVLFTAGGTGAGKTTAITGLMGKRLSEAQIVYDTNMNNVDGAVSKIDAALAAGKRVDIVYVHRDAVDSLVNGALPRAAKIGRTVPIVEHARTHSGAPDVMKKVAEIYASDPRVSVVAIDNSKGKGNLGVMPVDKLPTVSYHKTLARVYEALESEYANGKISRQIYEGTRAGFSPEATGPAAAEKSGGGGGRGNDRQPQQGRAPREDLGGDTPAPEPGETFIVYRVGGGAATLAGRNAANAQGLADFLARSDDAAGPVKLQGDTISTFAVTIEKPFGPYHTMNKGRGVDTEGSIVGRQDKNGAVSYSFPKDGYRAQLMSTVPLAEARAKLAARGLEDFDDAGSITGAKAIREVTAPPPKPGEPVPIDWMEGPVQPVQINEARTIAAMTPELEVVTDGVPQNATVALAIADDAIERAKRDGPLHQAAVECLLRG